MEAQLQDSDSAFATSTMRRIKRVKGTLIWTLETEYHARLTRFDENLRTLDEAMAVAQKQHEQFVRARQAATHSYVGYESPIKHLRSRVSAAADQVDVLMARQGRTLEVVAIEELMARRDRLEGYRDKARFALADSFDRATQAQAKSEEP